jgi:hypothetical protein
MTLVDIEAVIKWLDENIDSYDIEMGDVKSTEVRTFYDLKVDLQKWAEKGGCPFVVREDAEKEGEQ